MFVELGLTVVLFLVSPSWRMIQGPRYAVRKATPASLNSHAAIKCCSR
jgi:hypothetical protein